MLQLLALVLLTFGGGSSSCRFPEEVVDWQRSKLAPPAAVSPTTVRAETCAGGRYVLGCENTSTLSGSFSMWTDLRIRFQGTLSNHTFQDFDNDGTPDDLFVDIELAFPDTLFRRLGVFDGVVDFAGPSGRQTILNVDPVFSNTVFAVADPDFFTQPGGFLVTERVVISGYSNVAGGNVTIVAFPIAAAGTVFHFDE